MDGVTESGAGPLSLGHNGPVGGPTQPWAASQSLGLQP